MKYKSKTGLFEIELPNNTWEAEYNENVYSFSTNDIEGVLQILLLLWF